MVINDISISNKVINIEKGKEIVILYDENTRTKKFYLFSNPNM